MEWMRMDHEQSKRVIDNTVSQFPKTTDSVKSHDSGQGETREQWVGKGKRQTLLTALHCGVVYMA